MAMTRIRAQCEAYLFRSCLWCVVHPLSCSGIHCLADGTIVNCGRVRVFCSRRNASTRLFGSLEGHATANFPATKWRLDMKLSTGSGNRPRRVGHSKLKESDLDLLHGEPVLSIAARGDVLEHLRREPSVTPCRS